MEDKIKKKIEEEALRRFTKSGGKKSFSSVNRSIFTSACYWYHENFSTEQLVNALKSVEIYLRNQDLSEIGKQVQGKVLEALSSASNESRKESVNEKLVKATQKLLDEIVFHGVYFKNHTLVQDVILTASKQENNECWINFTKTSPKEYGRYLVYRGGKIHFETWNNTGWAYNHNSITHWKQINPPKEK